MPAFGDAIRDYLPRNQPADYTLVSRSSLIQAQFAKKKDEGRSCRIGDEDARLQVVSCFENWGVSVTVRGKDHFKEGQLRLADAKDWRMLSGYKPSPECGSDTLNSVHEICQVLFDAIELHEKEEVHGFLIVSGTTNSLKSQLALGLIHMYLERRMRKWLASGGKQRKPHLVTCEDDIERYFLGLGRLKDLAELYATEAGIQSGIWLTNTTLPDYTPRHKKKDVSEGKLDKAVESALRMTPAVFYAGEIRDPEDWPSLYRLAQSHLVVLTTHASGLVNTFEILQHRLKIENPAQNSELASTVLAVIHMRSGPPLNSAGEKKVEIKSVVPACWRNTLMGVSSFTSDGLASLVPRYVDLRPRYGDTAKSCELPYAMGRRTFGEVLLALAKKEKELKGLAAPHLEKWGKKASDVNEQVKGREQAVSLGDGEEKRFLRQCTSWDLRGE